MNDDHCLNIDFEELGSFDYQYIELKSTAKERAAQRGAREDNDSHDGAMSMSVFRDLLKHVRAHYPVEVSAHNSNVPVRLYSRLIFGLPPSAYVTVNQHGAEPDHASHNLRPQYPR